MVKAPKLHLNANKKQQKQKLENGKNATNKIAIEKPIIKKMKPAKANDKKKAKIVKNLKPNAVKPTEAIKAKVKQTAAAAAPKKPKAVNDKKLPTHFEPVHVEEAAFDAIVNLPQVTKIATALKQLVEGQVAKQKKSIFEDYNYCLNVSCFKIPSCPKRMVKLNLKHPLVNMANDDVVLVVPDLKRGAKVEYDSTIEHYTDLLREAGVEGLTIMPFNQLRNEYKTFEAKNKLASTFDYYLCDGRIVGQVSGFCGTIFQKPRTTFHAVRLDRPKAIKTEIEKALRRTAYRQLHKGDLITIVIGNDKFDVAQVAENVMHVIAELKGSYPGGISNIRGIDLKINILGTSSLPIYVSTSEGPQEAPYVVGPREQHMLDLKKEANVVLSKFNLTKEGEIKRLSKPQVERKRKIKEARAELLAEPALKPDDVDKVDEVDEGESVVVPAKKSKIVEEEILVSKQEQKQKPAKKQKQKKAQKVAAAVEDDVEQQESEVEANQQQPTKALKAAKQPKAAKAKAPKANGAVKPKPKPTPAEKTKPQKPVKEKPQKQVETAKKVKKDKKDKKKQQN